MQYEINKIYNFTVRRVELHRGDPYFILADEEGQESIHGYENDGWVFRTKVLDFQRDWDGYDVKGRLMPCLVKRFNKDAWGYNTTFPYLVQDINHILKSYYKENENYDFEISAIPGESLDDEKVAEMYHIQDVFGFHHYLREEGATYKNGQRVNLRVTRIEKGHLYFELPRIAEIPNFFKVGEKYTFEVCDVMPAGNGKGGYYWVKDREPSLSLKHRYYFNSEPEKNIGDEIELRVKGFSEKGWLKLEDATIPLPDEEWNHIATLEGDEAPMPEGQHLEYKKSFVYTSSGMCDIDRQLGHELMIQIAAFMNAEGGELRIGYRDDGTPCGIHEDLDHINSGSEDKYAGQYNKSIDKICLKFMNTITYKLGAFVASKVQVELKQREQKLVCHIKVPRLDRPVWIHGNELYVRCLNSVRQLKNSHITDYICDRCRVGGGAAVVPPVKPVLPEDEDVKPLTQDADLEHLLPESVSAQKIWKHITLYKDGCASQQGKAVDADDVLMNIPVGVQYKKKSDRLLLCYDNGCVNVLNPSDVINKKLNVTNRKYANGYNNESGVKLLQAIVCHVDDYLILRSRTSNGMEMLKAVQISKAYRVHGANSMQTKGNLFIKPELAVPYDMEIVPSLDEGFIKDIVCKSSERYGPGYAVQSSICKDAVEYLNRRRYLKAQAQG